MAKRPPSDPQFEIGFYENILKRSPDFIEALMCLGDLYTKEGRYADGLLMDERLARLRPDDATVHYNLACSYSLVDRIPDADRAMRRAFDLGYEDLEHLSSDPDLQKLLKHDAFQAFFEEKRAKGQRKPRSQKERAS